MAATAWSTSASSCASGTTSEGVVLVGFGCHRGRRDRRRRWGAPPQRMQVPPAPEGSHEALLHRAAATTRRCSSSATIGATRRGWPAGAATGPSASSTTRARERSGNCVPTVMGRRYDAFCYFETTEALRPLAV